MHMVAPETKAGGSLQMLPELVRGKAYSLQMWDPCQSDAEILPIAALQLLLGKVVVASQIILQSVIFGMRYNA